MIGGGEDKKPRKRMVSAEEKALWESAMKDVARLPRDKPVIPVSKTEMPKQVQPPAPPVWLPSKEMYAEPVDIPLEKRQAKKIRQGKIPIDATIDLHGFTEAAAYENLLCRIGAAYNQGKRCVLVVTGKGREGKGILAQRVPEWLRSPALKGKIIRIAEALPQHGGSGAIYVFLKQKT